MKKVLSLVLALALVLAVAVPAFAAAPTPNITDPSKLSTGISTKVDGETTVGTIKVIVPTAAKMVVNPYGLVYTGTVNNKTFAANDNMKNQIIYPTQYITSLSTSKLAVSANITGVVAGNAKLVTSYFDPTEDHTAGTKYPNNIFLVFQTMDAAVGDTAGGSYTAPNFTDITDDPDAPLTDGTVNHDVVVSTKGTTLKVGELAAVASADINDTSKAVNLAFRFTGVAEQQPDTPWTDKDKVTATIAFTFAPMVTAAGTP